MRANFDDLIRAKLRLEEQKEQPIELMVQSLGKTLQFTAPTRDQQLDFIGECQRAGDLSGSYEAYRKLIYDCCPALHDDKLHTELGAVDPYDCVDKLFLPLEVMNLGDQLADKFMKVSADIKN